MAEGTIFKFHNDLDTDQIIASQYLLLPNLDEMKGHAFESLDPDFSKKVKPGDFVVGGENFGCGSSREQAPGVLKALGVQAVVAIIFSAIVIPILLLLLVQRCDQTTLIQNILHIFRKLCTAICFSVSFNCSL